jgi:hypothetical protein
MKIPQALNIYRSTFELYRKGVVILVQLETQFRIEDHILEGIANIGHILLVDGESGPIDQHAVETGQKEEAVEDGDEQEDDEDDLIIKVLTLPFQSVSTWKRVLCMLLSGIFSRLRLSTMQFGLL